jgi:hypothetical protein
MPTKLTVFYAWQSDTPLKYNKLLIKKALLDAALRINEDQNLGGAQIIIDSDTSGILGTPPVTETILNKIASADIFAPDLTFVATTANNKLIPNPNVMIEWGYALKSHGFKAMLPIMNTHFGEPSKLPFDMGHIRHPTQYTIDPIVTKDAERRATRTKLSETIEEILREYLKDREERSRRDKPFVPHQGLRPPSFYFNSDYPLVTFEQGDSPLTYKSQKALYMRLYPIFGGQPRIQNVGAQEIIHKLKPMGDMINPVCKANNFGAIVVDTNGVRINALTQLFSSGELWGLSDKPFRSGIQELVAAVNVEKTLTHTLHNYLLVVKNDLKLIPPFMLELGLTGIQGLLLLYPGIEGFVNGMRSRHFVVDSFHRSYQLEGFDWAAWQAVLRIFFEDFYDLVGLRRSEVMTNEIIAENRLPTLI